MKANEEPEKIYCIPTEGGCYYITTIKPEPPFAEGVEYIQTDAFIEKAVEWFRKIDYDDSIPPFETTEEFIEGFKKAMRQ